ncbi:hypothetical protein F442_14549 [Phytophthora nicotianae P10297]|uniref:HTH CENPB-type domain-containing protein n=1 Tax=Phytophthora nicotianae P10297 TaxID=1317064 RepID=W2YRP4_PHYNI|nr:hypothetical protein F442_14549 [Phytophthora nicotianae P10297]
MPRGRKRVPGGGGRQSSNYQREVETYLKRLERENKRKRIYEWLKDREHIESVCSSSVKAGLKVIRKVGTATTISTAGEEALKEWVLSLCEEGVPVSRLMLQLKRQGLRILAKTRPGQKKPADVEADAKEFWKNVAQVEEELGVEKVYNADQSGVCFEYLPKHTISEKGAKTVWVRCGGKDKERLTGMFLGDSTGKQYTPFLVLKAQPSTKEHKIVYNHIVQNGFNTLWPETSAFIS